MVKKEEENVRFMVFIFSENTSPWSLILGFTADILRAAVTIGLNICYIVTYESS